ncbi:FtsK/SpoIIIE domain-containing protein [Flavonifractor sp. AGMB03687]|uniref:FtsK/SpoIIIE domain-containing protein n=1 Tax=Flavonifractor sp. AGMB03687 TaxID=2785133 RepID=UPI001ADF6B97|nr:FtsK/SpoIIIE domain-containing protein [Flavonifractor sp. AGMB03687]
MRTYHHDAAPLAYAPPAVNLLLLGLSALVLGGVLALGFHGLASVADVPILGAVVRGMGKVAAVSLGIGVAGLIAAAVVHRLQSDSAKIRHKVRRALCHPRYGNPLRLREGELLPGVNCKDIGGGVYELTIEARSCTVEAITDAASAISTAVNGRFVRYAVTQTDAGVAHDKVVFRLEDVLVDPSLTFHNAEEMKPVSPTRLRVQDGADIDLTTSGSMLVAGKTRSGKTTGIIALLLQALQCGRDEYGSEVIVIDPKQAELSRLPHVVTLDEDGEAREILAALRWFAGSIIKRQRTLNDLSEQSGDAVKWWEAGMHPSFLFIDEYVALRSIFPPKAAKDSDYCVATFDNIIKRIVTMGASAGCYVIISIAEASVQEGGLPAMLRSAMSTRVLFRPTRSEALLLWDKTKLDTMPDRVYGPGDAWFSSTDGVHDAVSYVHFPRMEFPVYQALGQLLSEYYNNDPVSAPPAAV